MPTPKTVGCFRVGEAVWYKPRGCKHAGYRAKVFKLNARTVTIWINGRRLHVLPASLTLATGEHA